LFTVNVAVVGSGGSGGVGSVGSVGSVGTSSIKVLLLLLLLIQINLKSLISELSSFPANEFGSVLPSTASAASPLLSAINEVRQVQIH
jgi:hypothetical protein